MKSQVIPLVGSFEASRREPVFSTSNQDQTFINFMLDVQKSPSGSVTPRLIGRPGLVATSSSFTSVAVGRGIYYWTTTGALYAIWDSTLYKGTTSLGTLASVSGGCHFEEFFDGTNQLLLITDEGGALWQVTSGDVITKVSDADFTAISRIGYCAPLSDRVFVMDASGRIYQSDSNSVTSWTAGAYITAGSYPDGGVGIIRWGERIVAFGQYSTEFFEITGGPISILGQIRGAGSLVGCVNYKTIRNVGDRIFWVGRTKDNMQAVYTFDGYRPVKISTAQIERQLQLNPAVSKYTGWQCTISGRQFYCLNPAVAANNSLDAFTLAYDVDQGTWHSWGVYSSTDEYEPLAGSNTGQGGGNGGGNIATMDQSQTYLSTTMQLVGTYDYTSTSTTRTLHQLLFTGSGATTDFGSSDVRYEIRTSKISLNNGMPVTVREIELLADYNGNNETVTIDVSYDDYQSYTTSRSVTVSQGGRAKAKRFGFGKEPAVRLVCRPAANTTFPRFRAIRISYDEAQI